MTHSNSGWSRTTAEPIYEQLLREADEGIRRSVLAGQSSQPGAPHPPPAANNSGWSARDSAWTSRQYPPSERPRPL